jgi:hypothetical protein
VRIHWVLEMWPLFWLISYVHHEYLAKTVRIEYFSK